MDDSRVTSIMGSRNRERLQIDGIPMAVIHHYSDYTLVYTSRHLTINIAELKQIFVNESFLDPIIVINPAFIKNGNDTYFGKITFDKAVSVESIKETICLYREKNDNNNDINVPIAPKAIYQNLDGSVSYKCGRCATEFKKANRCPECGQLVKE